MKVAFDFFSDIQIHLCPYFLGALFETSRKINYTHEFVPINNIPITERYSFYLHTSQYPSFSLYA